MFCTSQQTDPVRISLDWHAGSSYTGVTVNGFFFKIILSTSVCAGFVLLCGLLSSCGEGAALRLPYAAFSLPRLTLSTGSRPAGFRSCGTWAQQHVLSSWGTCSVVGARGLSSWGGCSALGARAQSFLDQRNEPMSPALEGGFFTRDSREAQWFLCKLHILIGYCWPIGKQGICIVTICFLRLCCNYLLVTRDFC